MNTRKILHSRYLLSTQWSSAHPGALIRVEFDDTTLGPCVGYADIHPWPEFGDPDLDTQLSALAGFKRDHSLDALPVIARRSLGFALVDGRARAQRVSLFAGLPVPESHFLVTHLESLTPDLIRHAASQGFKTFKIKAGKNPAREIKFLSQLTPTLAGLALKLRIDFNAQLTPGALTEFIDCLDASKTLSLIDYLEDPTSYDPIFWGELRRSRGLRLAADLCLSDDFLIENAPPAFDVLVLKPAIQELKPWAQWARTNSLGVTVTSYLDHPVGILHAAREAALLTSDFSVESCGLLSHLTQTPTEFSAAIKNNGPRLLTCEDDYGIGFERELSSTEWISC